jgi:tetratricopeptide (TPR) repeat protein
LLPAERRRIHARALEAIERLFPDRLGEHVERLAHHAFKAELWQKAVTYMRQAAAKAFARSANRESLVMLEQALAALQHLPMTHAAVETAIDIRFDLRHSLLALGDLKAIFPHLHDAEALATQLGDRRRLGWAAAYSASNFTATSVDHGRAIESGERALAAARQLDDFPLRVSANFFLSMTYHAIGDYRKAVGLLRWNVDAIAFDQLAERFGLNGPASVFSRAWLVWSLAELGQFPEGIVRGEEAVQMAAALQLYSLSYAYLAYGALYLRKGDLDRGISTLEAGRSV